jgi:uncharacterized iron-regulated membrane protein
MSSEGEEGRLLILLFALILIVFSLSAFLLLTSHGSVGPTPVITMTYWKSAPGDYNFTVVGVNWNDVKWSDITVYIDPFSGRTITFPGTMNVVAGDTLSIWDLTPGSTYTITLLYTPTGGSCYQVTLTAA